MKVVLLAAMLLLQSVAPPGVKVSGRVIREDPTLANRQNSVRLSGNGSALFATVAADGTFEFANVPAGAYQVMVGPQITMTPVDIVVAGKDLAGLELRVPATGTGLTPAVIAAARGNQANNFNNNQNNQSNRGGNTGNPLVDVLDGIAGGAPTPEQIQALIDTLGARGARGNVRNALKQIAVFDREGKLLSTVSDPVPASMITVSPDGARVAYAQSDGDIMTVDLANKTGLKIASEGRGAPTWSPDGRRIAYMATRNGVAGLYVKAANGMGDEELLLAAANSLSQWSSDGRFIISGIGNNFVVLPTGGDRKPVVIFSASGRTGLHLSPDSRFLAYTSTESGSNQVWVRTFDPTGAAESSTGITQWRISSDGAAGLVRWRNDGRELYYIASDGRVIAVPITTAPAFKAGTPVLLFKAPQDFPLQPSPGNQQADVSADGKRFVFLSPVAGAPPQPPNVNNNNNRGGRGGNNNTNNNNNRGGNNPVP